MDLRPLSGCRWEITGDFRSLHDSRAGNAESVSILEQALREVRGPVWIEGEIARPGPWGGVWSDEAPRELGFTWSRGRPIIVPECVREPIN